MFIIKEITSSMWSAIAATFSATAAIISAFIGYKSYSNQKKKDEINLKPNLFIKGEKVRIKRNISFYFNKTLKGKPVKYLLPFKFIELQNLSNEQIVDLTVKAKYTLQNSDEINKELKLNGAEFFYKINNTVYQKSLFLDSNEIEVTKKGLVEGQEKFIIDLPDNIMIDLLQNISHKKDSLLFKIELEFKYSHRFAEKPVQFKKEITINVSGYQSDYESVNLEYETYVFPKV
ncbi:TPA: hypothetical protein ACHHOD_001825 [Staphylococcus aureus]|uniref:hypothetical protein n=1 Tax=Staphylococcus aureus TaxID=1280 RepID=UPI0013A6C5FA|nr:hypothetical protein [Staphylococcus aureus]MBH4580157.1 hypothetical protein [Staphylococcus aureus]MBH4585651.1 hypothetical protein [Staphylococcus aureus]MBH4586437.1 hypothetical protein [Staphylococcus aureus]MBH4588949.1 hypothetical protein [Staphylococcus aureus]MBH4591652.1 hypothetical protein [Staphylococcus aureus]